MKNFSLRKITSLLIISVLFYSPLEAAQGASKSYKVSVTIPAVYHASIQPEARIQPNTNNFQMAMEQDIRNNEKVLVKTVVAK